MGIPERCWAYLLAFVANAILGFYLERRRLTRSDTTWIGKLASRGAFGLLTTSGGTFLAYWGVQDVGPAIGVFWVVGYASGTVLQYSLTITTLVHASGVLSPGFQTPDRRRVRAAIRLAIASDGATIAGRKGKDELTKIRREMSRKVKDERNRLQEEIFKLKRDKNERAKRTGRAIGKLRASRKASIILGRKYKDALHSIGTLAAQAAINNAGSLGEWGLRELITTQLNHIVDVLGGSDRVRASFFHFPSTAKEGQGFMFAHSTTRRPEDAFDQAPVSRAVSLEGAALEEHHDFHWPDKPAPYRVPNKSLENYKPKTDSWPWRWYIPIPFLLDRFGTKSAPIAYGVIRVDARSDYRWEAELEPAVLAQAALTDAYVVLDRACQVCPKASEKVGLKQAPTSFR